MPLARRPRLRQCSQITQILNAKTGPNFKIVVDLDSVGGVIQTITLRTGLPAGLRWGRNAPEPDEGCTVNVSVVCTQKLTANDVGTVGGEWIWDVVADRPGSYEITASVEGEQSDPVPSNNTFTSNFEVVRPPTAGGGSVAAGAVKLTPVKPKAGSAVTATARVTAAGTRQGLVHRSREALYQELLGEAGIADPGSNTTEDRLSRPPVVGNGGRATP